MNGKTPQPNIILVGLRTSGKSTVGKLLAARANRPFIDLDQHIVQAAGLGSVRAIFEQEGEQGFRARESETLKHVLKLDSHIIALGGGTPTAPGAAQLLEHARDTHLAHIIYLRWPWHTLADRLTEAARADRPTLADTNSPAGEMQAVFQARDPLYRTLASTIIEPETHQDAHNVADRVWQVCTALNKPR